MLQIMSNPFRAFAAGPLWHKDFIQSNMEEREERGRRGYVPEEEGICNVIDARFGERPGQDMTEA